jgi:hypothetical protein
VYDRLLLPVAEAIGVFTAPGPLALSVSNLLFYEGGVTNRLLLTPAAGGTTINTLDPTNVQDGWPILVINNSASGILYFNHLTGGGGGMFSNMNGEQVQIPTLGAALLHRIGGLSNIWQFA